MASITFTNSGGIDASGPITSEGKNVLTTSDIYNGLDKTTTGSALDATQGKVLNDAITAIKPSLGMDNNSYNTLQNTTDADSVTKTCVLYTLGASNLPATASSNYGYLTTIVASPDLIKQTYTAYNSLITHERLKINGTWSIWNSYNDVVTYSGTVPTYGGNVNAYKQGRVCYVRISALGTSSNIPSGGTKIVPIGIPESFYPITSCPGMLNFSGSQDPSSQFFCRLENNVLVFYSYSTVTAGDVAFTYITV